MIDERIFLIALRHDVKVRSAFHIVHEFSSREKRKAMHMEICSLRQFLAKLIQFAVPDVFICHNRHIIRNIVLTGLKILRFQGL